ncbi:hypothetical protein Fmac_008620 [Flemingia macrophylla]|uniref:Reverse transcriptase zinc-binding domain-containing protein n=1 Tax=Flemingia macrophylla TaxID=520843 RepID=A0ABD1MXW4_9FABA
MYKISLRSVAAPTQPRENELRYGHSEIVEKFGLLEDVAMKLTSTIDMFVESQEWSIPHDIIDRIPSLEQRLLKVPTPNMCTSDQPVWRVSSDGIISMKLIRNHLVTPGHKFFWGNLIWNHWTPLARSCLAWMILWGRVPTDEKCMQIGMNLVSICSICGSCQETMQHVFFTCSCVLDIWRWLSDLVQHNLTFNSLEDVLHKVGQRTGPLAVTHLTTLIHKFHINESRHKVFGNRILVLALTVVENGSKGLQYLRLGRDKSFIGFCGVKETLEGGRG